MFASHRAGAASIDLQAGHYHFFNPTISVAVQVKVFVQAVGKLANTDLPPVIDLETPSLYAKIPLAKRLPLIMSFVLAVEKAFGVKPLIYCNRTFVSGTLAGPGIDTSVLGAYMLYLGRIWRACRQRPHAALDLDTLGVLPIHRYRHAGRHHRKRRPRLLSGNDCRLAAPAHSAQVVNRDDAHGASRICHGP